MWLGILIGLGIITKAHGYSSGYFPEVCQSMSPSHSPFSDQEDKLPFEVTYELGKSGEPITGTDFFSYKLVYQYRASGQLNAAL